MTVHPLRPNVIDPTGQRSFPNASIETKMLVEFFVARHKAGEGETITYSEMEKQIGRDCRPSSQGYRYLSSARRILLRDHGVLLDAEAKVGVHICTNEEKMLVSGRDMSRARRAVRRSRQKLTAVEYDRLDDSKKKEWNARMSIVGALELMSGPKVVGKIERVITDHALPSAATLALFKS